MVTTKTVCPKTVLCAGLTRTACADSCQTTQCLMVTPEPVCRTTVPGGGSEPLVKRVDAVTVDKAD